MIETNLNVYNIRWDERQQMIWQWLLDNVRMLCGGKVFQDSKREASIYDDDLANFDIHGAATILLG